MVGNNLEFTQVKIPKIYISPSNCKSQKNIAQVH